MDNNSNDPATYEGLSEYEFITPYSQDGSDHTCIVGLHISLQHGKWSYEKLVSLDFDFSLFIVAGTVHAYIGEDTFILGKGDSIYLYSGIEHNFYNAGDSELIMIGYGERHRIPKS